MIPNHALTGPSAAARHALLAASSLFMLMPFVWMASLSVKSPGEAFASQFSLLPETFYGLENYREALTSVPLLRFMANGALAAGAVLAVQLAIAAPCADALAKLRFPGRDALFALVIVALLAPQEVLGLPLFVLFHLLGLLDTYAALIVIGVKGVAFQALAASTGSGSGGTVGGPWMSSRWPR